MTQFAAFKSTSTDGFTARIIVQFSPEAVRSATNGPVLEVMMMRPLLRNWFFTLTKRRTFFFALFALARDYDDDVRLDLADYGFMAKLDFMKLLMLHSRAPHRDSVSSALPLSLITFRLSFSVLIFALFFYSGKFCLSFYPPMRSENLFSASWKFMKIDKIASFSLSFSWNYEPVDD